MRISVLWDNPEHTVVYCFIPANWTWDDMAQLKTQFTAMIQTIHYTVDMILDLSQTRLMPQDAFINIRHYWQSVPTNLGSVVLVKTNPFFRTMVHQAQKLFPQTRSHLDFADTVEEARILLAKKRAQRMLEAAIEPVGVDRE